MQKKELKFALNTLRLDCQKLTTYNFEFAEAGLLEWEMFSVSSLNQPFDKKTIWRPSMKVVTEEK